MVRQRHESSLYLSGAIQVFRRNEIIVQEVVGLSGAILEGSVTGRDGPVEGANVHLYPDTSRSFRGPGLFGPQGAVLHGTGRLCKYIQPDA